MKTEDCLEGQLFLELENQGKTQSRWRGIQEREDVYSKKRLHHWQRDVPVPTIAAGSVFQKGFLCVMVVAKETENTVKLPANDGEKPFFPISPSSWYTEEGADSLLSETHLDH